jgi:anti-anti-sigma regulatory factor
MGLVHISPLDGNDGCEGPRSSETDDDRLDQREFRASQVVAGVVSVTVPGVLSARQAGLLRDALLERLARGPRMVIVEFVPVVSRARGGIVLASASISALVSGAREAGEADIGLCLVVPPDHMAAVENALGAADVADLFEIHPTVASALRTLP